MMKPVYLKLSVPSGKLATGSSRFWGNPDLPKGFAFPTYIDEEGEECHYFFICQINLKELGNLDSSSVLPKEGLLSFFAKIDYYMGYWDAPVKICGSVSGKDAVKVLYFPPCEDMEENVLVDDENNPVSPRELQIDFRLDVSSLSDEHLLFAPPTHCPWETWDPPFEDWRILLQIDSFEGEDFGLNFMDCGVMDFLISPSDLKRQRFDNVRAIILST